MKKLLIVSLLVLFCLDFASNDVSAQGKRRPAPARPAFSGQSTVPVYPAPVFLSRTGPAPIGEMMSQPPTFSYGSSINIWFVTDKQERLREVAVTGHADSPTCRRVSGQVMSMFLKKID